MDKRAHWTYVVQFTYENGLLNGDYEHDDKLTTRLRNNLVGVFYA